jgi:hypothetical protein
LGVKAMVMENSMLPGLEVGSGCCVMKWVSEWVSEGSEGGRESELLTHFIRELRSWEGKGAEFILTSREVNKKSVKSQMTVITLPASVGGRGQVMLVWAMWMREGVSIRYFLFGLFACFDWLLITHYRIYYLLLLHSLRSPSLSPIYHLSPRTCLSLHSSSLFWAYSHTLSWEYQTQYRWIQPIRPFLPVRTSTAFSGVLVYGHVMYIVV